MDAEHRTEAILRGELGVCELDVWLRAEEEAQESLGRFAAARPRHAAHKARRSGHHIRVARVQPPAAVARAAQPATHPGGRGPS